LCDWAHYGLCPTGLKPEPCQKEGANCDRSAHRLCVSGWEAQYDMGQQGIATLCLHITLLLGWYYIISQKVAAQSKDVAQKLKFDAQENESLKGVKGDGDDSTTGSTVNCSTLINTPPPLKTKEMDPSSGSRTTNIKDVVIYTGLFNMKVNLSNPKKWPKCHWSFQEQCPTISSQSLQPSWLLQLRPQQMRTRMVSSS
jgi:hypothetical protein